MDRRTSAGQSQSKATITVDDPQVVRIIHPHHPLAGQCMPVVRRIRAKSDPAVPRLIIHHPQLGNLSIPQAWTTAVEQPTLLPADQAPPTTLAADRRTLLALAKVVQTIQSRQFEEEADAYPISAGPRQPPDLGEPDRRPTAATDQLSGPAAAPIPGRSSGNQPAAHHSTSEHKGESR
jgi:hypothetical protein